ncbi:MAG TPA: hypothetical protein VGF30_09285 [Bacteroidia bacterium]
MNTFPLRSADAELQQLVNRITKMAGIINTIDVYAFDGASSCTTCYIKVGDHDKPVICYNPYFIDQLNRRNPLAVTAVFAQQIAHFYNKRLDLSLAYSESLHTNRSTRPKINPDKFTGWVMWHESIQLNDVIELYDFPRFSEYDHTGRNKRMMLMKEGWKQAHARLLLPPKIKQPVKEVPQEKEPEPVITSAPQSSKESENMLVGLFTFAFIAGGMSMLLGDK